MGERECVHNRRCVFMRVRMCDGERVEERGRVFERELPYLFVKVS